MAHFGAGMLPATHAGDSLKWWDDFRGRTAVAWPARRLERA